jgi:hypothetical protein
MHSAKSLRTAFIPKPSHELIARGLRASRDTSGHERTSFDTVLVAKVVANLAVYLPPEG